MQSFLTVVKAGEGAALFSYIRPFRQDHVTRADKEKPKLEATTLLRVFFAKVFLQIQVFKLLQHLTLCIRVSLSFGAGSSLKWWENEHDCNDHGTMDQVTNIKRY